MFNEEIYDLSRHVHMVYSKQFEQLYIPLQDEKPGLVRRLLAALRNLVSEHAPKSNVTGAMGQVSASTLGR